MAIPQKAMSLVNGTGLKLSFVAISFTGLVAACSPAEIDTPQTTPELLRIEEGWSPAMVSGETRAVYMTIANDGESTVQITGARSDFASHVMLHQSDHNNGVVRMQEMHQGISIAPEQSITFEPGGDHVMLSGLTRSPVVGETFEIELVLGNGTQVPVEIEVRPLISD